MLSRATLPHFAISSLTKAVYSSGELPTISLPPAASLSRTSGVWSEIIAAWGAIPVAIPQGEIDAAFEQNADPLTGKYPPGTELTGEARAIIANVDAGGILSAGVDGIKVAEAVAQDMLR